MTDQERRDAEECFLSWMRDNQQTLADCWAKQILGAPWFPPLDSELVLDLAFTWLSLTIDVFADRRATDASFAETVRRCATPALDGSHIRRCFELLEEVQLHHVQRDFIGASRHWASRLVVEHVDALREKCAI